ncbi:MAG: AEC family transporter [Ignavibacteria bacterium]|nr:AEC family transporter [Ignavibacteria bacterium]
MEAFTLIFDIVAPVFVIIAIGYMLFRFRIINDEFIRISSKLVFMIGLPCLIFKETSTLAFTQEIQWNSIIVLYGVTFISVIVTWIAASKMKLQPELKGAFVQGSVRGNFAIIGLALLANMQRPGIVAKGAVILAFIMPLYNIISIIVLTLPFHGRKNLSYSAVARQLYTNPLIIALLLAVLFSFSGIQLPQLAGKSIAYLSSLVFPLALISIGGEMARTQIKMLHKCVYVAAGFKVLILPIFCTAAAWAAGIQGDYLIILFIVFSSPTAVVSYIMAEGMGADSSAAGSIILTSTLFSLFSMSAGITVLHIYGVI